MLATPLTLFSPTDHRSYQIQWLQIRVCFQIGLVTSSLSFNAFAGKQRGNLVVGKEDFSSIDLTTAEFDAIDQELAAYNLDDFLFSTCADEAEQDAHFFRALQRDCFA